MLQGETTNDQGVAIQGEKIIILLPKVELTRYEALVHAAWLVALAGGKDFEEILESVMNS